MYYVVIISQRKKDRMQVRILPPKTLDLPIFFKFSMFPNENPYQIYTSTYDTENHFSEWWVLCGKETKTEAASIAENQALYVVIGAVELLRRLRAYVPYYDFWHWLYCFFFIFY